MDLEQLKAIMETIGIATGAAKTFGIFWLAIQLIKVLVGYSLVAAVIFTFYKIINRLISSVHDVSNGVSFLKVLRSFVVVTENNYGTVTNHEKDMILKAIKFGMERQE